MKGIESKKREEDFFPILQISPNIKSKSSLPDIFYIQSIYSNFVSEKKDPGTVNTATKSFLFFSLLLIKIYHLSIPYHYIAHIDTKEIYTFISKNENIFFNHLNSSANKITSAGISYTCIDFSPEKQYTSSQKVSLSYLNILSPKRQHKYKPYHMQPHVLLFTSGSTASFFYISAILSTICFAKNSAKNFAKNISNPPKIIFLAF